ncbi:MAG: 4a-hydroxytetrahydrobiopterin dehydratase, partial [Candidatus Staskawiczbacteria bacterium]|nr:4a-hydroxytetrahydrobiopterin dehydratase [Candidatus Staskawiczbacteria bacterium]
EKRGNKIAKEFKFADFMDSLNFINAIAPFCEKIR